MNRRDAPERAAPAPARSFLPLMVVAGCTMSLTAPLEVLFARDLGYSPLLMGAFMLTSGLGVILVDVLGTRLVPALDARCCLTIALAVFGLACIAMAFAAFQLMLVARLVQGFSGGLMLGGGLQAAIRVLPGNEPRALGRFSAAFLAGAALGAPGGLMVAAGMTGRHGFQVAFVGAGCLAVVVAVLLRVTLPRLPAVGAANPRPRLGLPGLASSAGGVRVLAVAMTGDFVRGGVLFTALPLAGAVRGYSTLAIGCAIALMSAVEIVMLVVAHRVLALVGVTLAVAVALGLGCACAVLLALLDGLFWYLLASSILGVALAGTTIGLPLIVVGAVGEPSAGLARFRISAGIGMMAGSVGCAVAGSVVGPEVLFSAIAIVLAASIPLVRSACGSEVKDGVNPMTSDRLRPGNNSLLPFGDELKTCP
jgi:MFS family permease